MNIYTTIFILSVFTNTGYSISCRQCLSMTDKSCLGSLDYCEPGQNACFSSYTVTNIGGIDISNIFERKCANRDLCNKFGSVSITHGQIKTVTSCCFTDDCTPPQKAFEADSTEKNGVICGVCSSVSSRTCTSEMEMECQGKETKCMAQTTVITEPVYSVQSVRGCATPSICTIGSQTTNVGNLKSKTEISCTDGSVGLYCNVFLLTLVLLFIKLFS
ncbi:phospholipase A2 inhibitor and Ly6/PLAUR domain-containing protein [Bombina bombina]|uniref:phospholipase A2 inhibitor and Ly6/PLAUR domain-containing protein n=1 Tax=Bombina bombina TaxID=8345 RepID=UPI00235A4B2A|nr:phospholipase A2 inhibitor and Ly6/PLAUR domain-containing protein [Bombina bombina]